MNSVGVVLLLLGCLALGVRGQQPCPDQTDPAVIVVATIFATLAVVFIVAGVIFFLIWRRRKGEVSFNFRGAPDPWSCVGVLFHHCIMLSSGRDDCLCCKLFIFYLYLDRCKSSCLNFDTYSHLSNTHTRLMKCELSKFTKDIISGEVILAGAIRRHGVPFCRRPESDVR